METRLDALTLSDDRFWGQVEEVPTIAEDEGPIVMQGHTLFPSLAAGKREMYLSCSQTSEYVETYLVHSDSKGTVLDLGCGIGANTIPLFQKGWKVIAIDNHYEAIESCVDNIAKAFLFSMLSGNVPSVDSPSIITGDIITNEYPENMDAVVCVDVLPYLPPPHLKATMEKIFRALRPGGQFVGTVFFKPTSHESPFTELMGKLGAHFYPGIESAREIVTRSGFLIKTEKERNDSNAQSHCLEFLAEKPS